MAFRVTAVSIKVSPLATLEVRGLMFTTSAPRRLPASSKLDWVRVEFSKNRFITVRPFKRSSFFEAPRFRATKESAETRRASAWGRFRSAQERKCRVGNGAADGRAGSDRGGGDGMSPVLTGPRTSAKPAGRHVARPRRQAHLHPGTIMRSVSIAAS